MESLHLLAGGTKRQSNPKLKNYLIWKSEYYIARPVGGLF